MQSFLVPIYALYFTKPSNTFSMAFQKVLRGFVARIRSKNFLLSFLNGLRGLYVFGIQQIKFCDLGFPPLFFINLFFYLRYLESLYGKPARN